MKMNGEVNKGYLDESNNKSSTLTIENSLPVTNGKSIEVHKLN